MRDASGKCPEPEGGPPVPLPDGKNGQPNEWVRIPGTAARPNKYKPKFPVPSATGAQPSASWDPEHGHWDVDNVGRPGRRRFLPDGTEVDHFNNPLPTPSPAEMRQAAGLATAVTILYWTISELSRLIPVRNLIPVP